MGKTRRNKIVSNDEARVVYLTWPRFDRSWKIHQLTRGWRRQKSVYSPAVVGVDPHNIFVIVDPEDLRFRAAETENLRIS